MAKDRSPLRLGFIGCGVITRHGHLRALRAVPEVEVVAVADVDSERLQRVADGFGIPRRYPDAAHLLADPAIEAVAVCVPAIAHVEVACAALQAQKHVFLEKPIALSLADSDRLIDAATHAPVIVQMGFNLRWHRLVREARSLLRDGTLGRIIAIRSAFTSDARVHADTPEWRRARASGGGEFFETAIHHFDLWRFLLDTEIQEVFARSHSNDWDDETAMVTAQLANGALASGVFSIATSGSSEVEIYGEKGRLVLSLLRFDGLEFASAAVPSWSVRSRLRKFSQTLAALPPATLRARKGGDLIDSYRLEWQHFVDCVRRNVPPACTLEDGRCALRAVLAAIESATRGRPQQTDLVTDTTSAS
ncbi:MAG TPA: Gfo/Idh/MocA family oxidoreductase [Gemmatimonadota bacterium]|nr:Gfo/Idh/MocA family oxidoreductase [Gemmatimonadota bacterium]